MNCKLILQGTAEGEKVFYLNEGRNTIGRDSSNDVQIVAEQVSRSHASIEVGPDKCEIKDLGSSNGTTVNGKKISSAVLENGDEITISGLILRFEIAQTDTCTVHGYVPKVTADRSVFATVRAKAVPNSLLNKISGIKRPQEAEQGEKKPGGFFNKLFKK